MKNILFVCTGNTCRSSMAEILFKNMLLEAGGELKNIVVKSAGVSAFPNQPASRNAISAMKKEGLDLTSHRSRQLTRDMIRDADLILTMTSNHKRVILSIAPDARHKTYTLKEYALIDSDINQILDISDPYGQPVDEYIRCADEIREALKKVLIRIQNKGGA